MARKPIILIRNGHIGTLRGLVKADILMRGERIAAVEAGLTSPPGATLVEAKGKVILPGLIDAHVHLSDAGGRSKEDFYSETYAALAGGVTTALVMPDLRPPLIDASSLAHALARAAQTCVCDHGLFVAATRGNRASIARVKNAVGLKLYMGSKAGAPVVGDFASQFELFKAYPPTRTIALHAEDDAALQFFTGQGKPCPPLCAELAVQRAIAMAGELQRRIHICHISTARELALVQDAKRRGVPVTCEVSPHHLFLTTGVEQHLGPRARMHPPLRPDQDVRALWGGLSSIDVIATDHTPRSLNEKSDDSTSLGVPGLETMLPLLLTAVHEQQLSYGDLVRLTAAGPAKIFGLADKGTIQEGAHADLVIVDPNVQWKIEGAKLRTSGGWTPFEGWQVRGKVERVYLRGEPAYDGERVLVEPGFGQRVKQSV
jgi:dihydroorotase (multifunctional complex type)